MMLSPLLFSILLLATVGHTAVIKGEEPSLHMNQTEIYIFNLRDFKINCKSSAPIQKCFFQFVNSTYDLKDGYKTKYNISYVGDGFENGDCGILIEGRENLDGNVTCGVQLKDSDTILNATGTIIFDESIGEAILLSNTKNLHFLHFNESEEMKFFCRAEGGKYSKTKLLFANELMGKAVGTNWINSTAIIAKFSDNGKNVACHILHPGVEEGSFTIKHLNVFYKPRAVVELQDGALIVPNSFLPGKEGSLSFQITANPNLTSVHWTINGKEMDGNKFQPWSINQSHFKQPHTWVVGMDVESYSKDYLDFDFQVHLTNQIGTSTVKVKIYKESSGMWLWIVWLVVLLLFVIAVLIILFLIRRLQSQKYAEDGKTLMERTFVYLEDKFMRTENCDISSQLKEDLEKAQIQEEVEWSDEFILPDIKCLNNLGKHARNFENENFEDWYLVEGTKYSLLKSVVKVFEGKLYFNPVKRQLVLVCIDPLGYSKLILRFFSQSAAVKFGERVRLLVNEFKVRPLVLATGEGGGGHLAQLVTYSMKNLQVEEEVKILEQKERGIHMHTVVFESPPAFRAIEEMAKETLDQDSLRLAITNYISDQKLVDCCASLGPHVGKVVFVKKMDAKHENQEQVKLLSENEQVLSNVGSLNLNYNKFNVEDLNEARSFERVKKEEENNSIPWFFFDKNEAALLKSQKKKDYPKKLEEIPPFEFSGDLKCISPSDVEFREFIAKVRLITCISYSEIFKDANEVTDNSYKLNLNQCSRFKACKSGSVFSGFSSEQEKEFVAQLYKNSFPEVRSMRQSQFLQLSGPEKNQWLKKDVTVLILIVAQDEKVEMIYSEGLKVVYFASDDVSGSEKLGPIQLNHLNCESSTKFKSELLPFFGKKKPVSEIFNQTLLDELSLTEILNFRCEAEVESEELYVPQGIKNITNKFISVSSFADYILSLKGSQNLNVISSDAGMGKTRFLEQLLKELRMKSFCDWVTRINLNQCCDKLKDFNDEMMKLKDFNDSRLVVANLELACKTLIRYEASGSEALDIADEERRYQIKCTVLCEKMKSGNAWILLDSFDEVCPMYRQQAKTLIGLLEGMGAHLVVATRTREIRVVVEALQIKEQQVFQLDSLEEKNVRRILIDELCNKQDKIEELERMLNKDEDITNVRDVLITPRNLKLVVDITKSRVANYLKEAELLNLLFDKSLELTLTSKLNIAASNALFASLREEMLKRTRFLHYKLAIDEVFHGGSCDWISEEAVQVINRNDFADVVGKEVFFKNAQVAQFLCAEYLLQAIVNYSSKTKFLMKEELYTALNQTEHKNLRRLMDSCCSLKFVVLSKPVENISFDGKLDQFLLNVIGEDLVSLFKLTANWFDLSKKISVADDSELPIFLALERGSTELIAAMLLKVKDLASPVNKDKSNKTVLHWLVIKQLDSCVTDNIEKFKKNFDEKDSEGKTALHYAAMASNEKIVQLLLQNGAKCNVFDKTGKAALHHAVVSGNETNTKMLLEKGLVNETKNKESCLQLAAQNGHLPLVQLFYENEQYHYSKHSKISTALNLAIENGHTAVADYLLTKTKHDKGDTWLHVAAVEGDLKLVFLLVDKNYSVNVFNLEGITPLQKATVHGHSEIVQFLLELGADYEIKDKMGSTCLHAAAAQGHLDLVRIFGQQLEVNSRDKSGALPLHLAAMGGHARVVKYLLAIGADPHAEDNQGNNCLHFSAKSGIKGMVKLFEEWNVPFKENNAGQTPLELLDAGKHKDLHKYFLTKVTSHNSILNSSIEDAEDATMDITS